MFARVIFREWDQYKKEESELTLCERTIIRDEFQQIYLHFHTGLKM